MSSVRGGSRIVPTDDFCNKRLACPTSFGFVGDVGWFAADDSDPGPRLTADRRPDAIYVESRIGGDAVRDILWHGGDGRRVVHGKCRNRIIGVFAAADSQSDRVCDTLLDVGRGMADYQLPIYDQLPALAVVEFSRCCSAEQRQGNDAHVYVRQRRSGHINIGRLHHGISVSDG